MDVTLFIKPQNRLMMYFSSILLPAFKVSLSQREALAGRITRTYRGNVHDIASRSIAPPIPIPIMQFARSTRFVVLKDVSLFSYKSRPLQAIQLDVQRREIVIGAQHTSFSNIR